MNLEQEAERATELLKGKWLPKSCVIVRKKCELNSQMGPDYLLTTIRIMLSCLSLAGLRNEW
jgi:hypothetical protein